MFLKTSRYYKLEDVTATDKRGDKVASKTLRLLPDVTGVLDHIIEDTDRLDHLAYKYYKESRHWWRICDANDEPSPLELLGKTPMATHRFTIEGEEDNAFFPWNRFLAVIADVIGVESALPEETVDLVQASRTVGSQTVLVEAEQFSRQVIVRHNLTNVSAEQLQTLWEDEGYSLSAPEAVRRIGKTLMIPSKPV